ncbi:hypothetical protein [Pseudomonas sp. USHLN015]|uniref:hypothetical protein n=1 Tax=Pseudomonas sp. USHLN015 TaxID=3081296 RepID=UPI00301D5D81
MFLIKAYRWTIHRLHTAILKAAELKEREADLAAKAAAALKAKQLELQAEAASLEAEAARIKPLLG